MQRSIERLWDQDPIVRQASQDNRRSIFRAIISVVVSAFLFEFVGFAQAAIWLAIALAIEAMGAVVRLRLRAGDLRWRIAYVPVLVASSLAWVAHAILLWQVGDEIPRIAALFDLFTVCLYAAAGGATDRRLMLALLTPPLATLFVLVVNLTWTLTSGWVAAFTTVATLGSCAIILVNALLMNRGDVRLRKAAADLDAASQAKDAFLADVSHEVRTPLNGVVALAGALERTPLDPRQREIVGLIRESGETMRQLLSSLLDLSKAESGALAISAQPFDIGSEISAAVLPMRAMAEGKGLDFELQINANASSRLIGDALRLRQIAANLTSNAIKFTESGGVRVTLVTRLATDDRVHVELTVADTGPGMTDEMRARLFKRFSQLGPEAAEIGTGLGLAISQALANLMGGAIEVRSTLGMGSKFTFSAAFPQAPAQPAAADHDPQRQPPAMLDRPGLRVLLAEDHPVNRRAIELILEPFGAQVTSTENGRDCVAAYLREDFDVVLMDKRMPVMDGLDATRAIRTMEAAGERGRTPIIMLSADAADQDRSNAIAAGCDAHAAKPITPGILLEAIQAAVTLRSA